MFTEEFEDKDEMGVNLYKRGLKVNKRFENEVKEKESRKKVPKYLIESYLQKKQRSKPNQSDDE